MEKWKLLLVIALIGQASSKIHATIDCSCTITCLNTDPPTTNFKIVASGGNADSPSLCGLSKTVEHPEENICIGSYDIVYDNGSNPFIIVLTSDDADLIEEEFQLKHQLLNNVYIPINIYTKKRGEAGNGYPILNNGRLRNSNGSLIRLSSLATSTTVTSATVTIFAETTVGIPLGTYSTVLQHTATTVS